MLPATHPLTRSASHRLLCLVLASVQLILLMLWPIQQERLNYALHQHEHSQHATHLHNHDDPFTHTEVVSEDAVNTSALDTATSHAKNVVGSDHHHHEIGSFAALLSEQSQTALFGRTVLNALPPQPLSSAELRRSLRPPRA